MTSQELYIYLEIHSRQNLFSMAKKDEKMFVNFLLTSTLAKSKLQRSDQTLLV